MKLNKKETKVMVLAEEEEKINIEIRNTKIYQVNKLQYLRVLLDRNGYQEPEINMRIGNAIKLFYVMNHNFINKN